MSKLNEIRQHIPSFVEGYEPEAAMVDTLDSLLTVSFVKNFTGLPHFHQLSLAPIGDGRYHLMAEYREGEEYWVVGTLKELVEGLPEFKPRNN
jgi:hypothetical protein